MIQPAREVFYSCDFRCLYNGVHLRVVSNDEHRDEHTCACRIISPIIINIILLLI